MEANGYPCFASQNFVSPPKLGFPSLQTSPRIFLYLGRALGSSSKLGAHLLQRLFCDAIPARLKSSSFSAHSPRRQSPG
jgi:hypothetical protein